MLCQNWAQNIHSLQTKVTLRPRTGSLSAAVPTRTPCHPRVCFSPCQPVRGESLHFCWSVLVRKLLHLVIVSLSYRDYKLMWEWNQLFAFFFLICTYLPNLAWKTLLSGKFPVRDKVYLLCPGAYLCAHSTPAPPQRPHPFSHCPSLCSHRPHPLPAHTSSCPPLTPPRPLLTSPPLTPAPPPLCPCPPHPASTHTPPTALFHPLGLHPWGAPSSDERSVLLPSGCQGASAPRRSLHSHWGASTSHCMSRNTSGHRAVLSAAVRTTGSYGSLGFFLFFP